MENIFIFKHKEKTNKHVHVFWMSKHTRNNVNIIFQIGIHSRILACLEFAALFLNYSFTPRADKHLHVNVFVCAYTHDVCFCEAKEKENIDR